MDDSPSMDFGFPKVGRNKGMIILKFGPREFYFKRVGKTFEEADGLVRGRFKWNTLKRNFLIAMLRREMDDLCRLRIDHCNDMLAEIKLPEFWQTPEWSQKVFRKVAELAEKYKWDEVHANAINNAADAYFTFARMPEEERDKEYKKLNKGEKELFDWLESYDKR